MHSMLTRIGKCMWDMNMCTNVWNTPENREINGINDDPVNVCKVRNIHQINEMVYIENGGKQQIKEEIEAYKSLLPNGNELVATVMIEIDNPIKRAEFLGKMGGFEETFAISINGKQVFGKAELDMDRTTAEGKASSVQFVHFNFDREIANDFKSNDYEIIISVNHDTYKHSTTLNKETSLELSKDFF